MHPVIAVYCIPMTTIVLGPLAIPPDRLLLVIGFASALLMGWFLGRRRGVSVEPVLTAMLVIGLLGARAIFVLQYLDDYLINPVSIIDIRDGGFHFAAGVVLALTAGLLATWKRLALRTPLVLSVAAGFIIWGAGYGALYMNREAVELPPLPPLAFTDMDGNFVNLHELNDRPMVLNLWATWCPPCRREMPVFEAAQLRDQDIVYVFVNQGEDEERVLDYLLDDDLQLQNVLLDHRSISTQLLNARALPSTYYFDANGNMIDMHLGEVSTATLNRSLRQLRRHSTD